MKSLLLYLLIILAFSANAQTDTTYRHRKDIYDLIRGLVKKKKGHPKPEEVIIKPDSMITKQPKVYWSVLPGFGYALQKGFSAVSTNNASFYIKKDSDAKISSIDFIIEYTQFKQFLFPLRSNIWTKGNKFNIIGDWRYFKYSTKSYGLGGKTEDSDAELINYSHFRFYQLVLRQFKPNFLAGIGYNLDYHWNFKSDASNTKINKELRNYGYDSSAATVSSGITLNLLYDPRKNSNNPTEGYYANAIYRFNSTSLGSDGNWSSLQIDLRKYITFPMHSRNVLAFWNYNWFTLNGSQPYFDLPGNGWDTKANTAREYRQGRYTAKNMIYLETEYRFELTRNGLFAGVVFANALSVSNKENTKFDPVLPGAGIGIRMLTNKYSSTHLNLSYSVGVKGAQGFSFNLGETF